MAEPEPPKFTGWRRPKSRWNAGVWEKFCEGESKGAVYQSLMQRSELTCHEGTFEYRIMPATKRPE